MATAAPPKPPPVLTTNHRTKIDAQPVTIRPLAEFEVRSVDLSSIAEPTDNHRHALSRSQEQIAELAASLKQAGQQSPILIHADAKKAGRWQVVYGYGRLAAAKLAGMETIRAICASGLTPFELRYHSTTENLARLALNPIDEAVAVGEMIQASGFAATNDAIAYVAGSLGRSPTWVRDRAYLARLDSRVCKYIIQGRLPLGHAREIAKVFDHAAQYSIAQNVAGREDGSGGSDIASTKRMVADRMSSLKIVPWPLNVAFADAPACLACPKNATNDPGLFEHDHAKEDPELTCNDSACFNRKMKVSTADMNKALGRAAPQVSKGTLSASPVAIEKAGLVPATVKASTMARKLAASTATGKPGVKQASPANRSKQISDLAEQLYQAAEADESKNQRAVKRAIFTKVLEANKTNPWVGVCLSLLEQMQWVEKLTAYNAPKSGLNVLRAWVKKAMAGTPELALEILAAEKCNTDGLGGVFGPLNTHADRTMAAVAPEFGLEWEYDPREYQAKNKHWTAEATRQIDAKASGKVGMPEARVGIPKKKGKAGAAPDPEPEADEEDEELDDEEETSGGASLQKQTLKTTNEPSVAH